MNLSDMRTLVRRDLHDEDAEDYRWTNDELDRHITQAASEFSIHIPGEQKTTLSTTIGSRDIDVSSLTDRVSINAVEYPISQYPRAFQCFSLWQDTLTMLTQNKPSAVENVFIYWNKVHTLDVSTSTIPSKHERLVALGASAYAMLQFAAFSVDRINTGGENTPQEFMTEGQRRLDYFTSELKRYGKNNRVRSKNFYKPAAAPSSKSAVWDP